MVKMHGKTSLGNTKDIGKTFAGSFGLPNCGHCGITTVLVVWFQEQQVLASLDLGVLDGGHGRVEDPVGAGRGGGREGAAHVRPARGPRRTALQPQLAARLAPHGRELGAAAGQGVPAARKDRGGIQWHQICLGFFPGNFRSHFSLVQRISMDHLCPPLLDF